MNFEGFIMTLPYLVKGMIGIFVVTGLMILSIMGLNRFCPKD